MVIVVAVVDVVVMAEMEVIVVLQYSIRIVVVNMATKDVSHERVNLSRNSFVKSDGNESLPVALL